MARGKVVKVTDNAVSLSAAKEMLQVAFSQKLPVFLWGQPGVGKSDLIAQIANEQNRKVVDMRLLLCDPTDIKGIPYYDTDSRSMKMAPPAELPKDDGVFSDAILFLDEMNAAPPAVQAAAYQLILNRRVGEYHLPKDVDIVAAGNRESDKGVTFRMPTPLANRFVHIDVEVNFDDWQKWAILNNIHPDVVGFLSHGKQHLNNFDPSSPDKAFATPRTWAFVSRLCHNGNKLSDVNFRRMVAGTIGSGLAGSFCEHRKIAGKTPNPMDVLERKVKTFDCPEISAKYTVSVNLSYTLREQELLMKEGKLSQEKFVEYCDNFIEFAMNKDHFQEEMTILTVTTALSIMKIRLPVKQMKNFQRLYSEYFKYIK